MKKPTSASALAALEVTTTQAAELLGVTTRWIRELAAEGKLRRTRRGRFLLGQLMTDLRADYDRRIAAAGETTPLAAEQARLARVKADRAELELKARCGELVSVESEVALVGELLVMIVRAIDSFAGRICIDCAGKTAAQVKHFVDREAERIRHEIERGVGKLAAEVELLARLTAEDEKRGKRK